MLVEIVGLSQPLAARQLPGSDSNKAKRNDAKEGILDASSLVAVS